MATEVVGEDGKAAGVRLWGEALRRWWPPEPVPPLTSREVLWDAWAGVVTAFMMVPQALALAWVAAGVEAAAGARSVVLATLFYGLLGASPRLALGPSAVIAIMAKDMTPAKDISGERWWTLDSCRPSENAPDDSGDIAAFTAECAALALGAAAARVGMALVGTAPVAALLLSEPVYGAAEAAAAVAVLAAALPWLLGARGPPPRRDTYWLWWAPCNVAAAARETGARWTAPVVGATALAALVVVALKVNARLAQRGRWLLPTELLVLAAARAFAAALPADVAPPTVGATGAGRYIEPSLPTWAAMGGRKYFEAFVLAMASHAQLARAARTAPSPHKPFDRPVLRGARDLLALGVGDVACAFFGALPITASSSGCASLAALRPAAPVPGVAAACTAAAAAGLLCLACPLLLDATPAAALAAVAVFGVLGSFAQFAEPYTAWNVSKLDMFIWILTFVVCCVTDISLGLLTGLFISLILLFRRITHPTMYLVGRVKASDDHSSFVYTELKGDLAEEIPGVKIVSIRGTLNFANRQLTKKKFIELLKIDSDEIVKVVEELRFGKVDEVSIKRMIEEKKQVPVLVRSMKKQRNSELEITYLFHIICEITALKHLDLSGLLFLRDMEATFKKIQISFTFVSNRKFLSKCTTIDEALKLLNVQEISMQAIEEELKRTLM